MFPEPELLFEDKDTIVFSLELIHMKCQSSILPKYKTSSIHHYDKLLMVTLHFITNL